MSVDRSNIFYLGQVAVPYPKFITIDTSRSCVYLYYAIILFILIYTIYTCLYCIYLYYLQLFWRCMCTIYSYFWENSNFHWKRDSLFL